jgi:hypothetical protein
MLVMVICLGLFLFGCEAKQEEATQEMQEQKIEVVSSTPEATQSAAQRQEVIEEKTEEVIQEIEANMPKIEQEVEETLKMVEEKTVEALEEVKASIPEIADQVAKEVERVGEEIAQLPVTVSIPPSQDAALTDTSSQPNISVDQEKDAVISQGRWAFSQRNLKENFINYYDRDGNFLGRRTLN